MNMHRTATVVHTNLEIYWTAVVELIWIRNTSRDIQKIASEQLDI